MKGAGPGVQENQPASLNCSRSIAITSASNMSVSLPRPPPGDLGFIAGIERRALVVTPGTPPPERAGALGAIRSIHTPGGVPPAPGFSVINSCGIDDLDLNLPFADRCSFGPLFRLQRLLQLCCSTSERQILSPGQLIDLGHGGKPGQRRQEPCFPLAERRRPFGHAPDDGGATAAMRCRHRRGRDGWVLCGAAVHRAWAELLRLGVQGCLRRSHGNKRRPHVIDPRQQFVQFEMPSPSIHPYLRLSHPMSSRPCPPWMHAPD